MTGGELTRARHSRGWTQEEAAHRLGVTQAYVSMLERGKRPVSVPQQAAVRRLYGGHLAATALPLPATADPLPAARVATALASLGYPGYRYLRSSPRLNPAEVLLRALRHPALDARLVAGLPWLIVQYVDLDWSWVLTQARLANLQNRVGFMLALARQLAGRLEKPRVERQLAVVEHTFDEARLAREDSFSTALTAAETAWVRKARSAQARHWKVLTDLSVDDVVYVEAHG